jgi:capsular polysaccharide biosynthesis protein/glycosyltransferase involved in cell wall biosynthesis
MSNHWSPKKANPVAGVQAKVRPIISVIIATRNRAFVLRKCLESIERQEIEKKKYEVLVVDNRSHDDTCSIAVQSGCRYFYCYKISTSTARNLGAKEASGDWLAFFDDDCVIPPGWMSAALELIRRDPFLIFCGPADAPSGRPYPKWYSGAWESFRPSSLPTILPTHLYPIECNLLIQRKLYLRVGGMNEGLGPSNKRFGYHEGADMINRLRKQFKDEATVFYHPSIAVAHCIQSEKTRLVHRWKRQILAGLDHHRAHPEKSRKIGWWHVGSKYSTSSWRLLRLLFRALLNLCSRDRNLFPSMLSWLYVQGGQECYRFGESLGALMGSNEVADDLSLEIETSRQSKIRMRLMRKIRPILKQFSLGEIPVTSVQSTPELIRQNLAESGQILWEDTAQEALAQPSQDQQPYKHPRLSDSTTASVCNLWVAKLEGAQVVGPSIGVMTKNRTFLGDVSIEFSKSIEDHGMMRRFTLPPAQLLQGKSVLLGSTGGNTYHHWMMEVIPRLRLLREAGVDVRSFDHVLVNDTVHDFQRECLASFGIKEKYYRSFTKGTRYICETLYLPSLPGLLGRPLNVTCDFLRKIFLESTSIKSARRLWIGRKAQLSRSLQGADEIEQCLRQRGFEDFEPGDWTVRKQAQAFFGADWVVAAHGAALTNLAFCRPGTRVIELFSSEYVNPCYRDLCAAAGLLHYAVLSPKLETVGAFTELHDASKEIRITVKDLEKVLNTAGLDN